MLLLVLCADFDGWPCSISSLDTQQELWLLNGQDGGRIEVNNSMNCVCFSAKIVTKALKRSDVPTMKEFACD